MQLSVGKLQLSASAVLIHDAADNTWLLRRGTTLF